MGLASALSTALTGMNASETTIDVVGNNLANSNTVGFKSSMANFATQFLQTQSLGSAPTASNGGTDPRQTGLGTMVAGINPNFNQGTIQVSTNPTDLAIQGDGFFIVQASSGAQAYTRNGQFKLNSSNELVNSTGNRVLGFGVDSNWQVSSTTLQPISIPIGSAAVAQATQNAYLQGSLSPSGNLGTQGTTLQTAALTDGTIAVPDVNNTASPATLGTATGPGAPGATLDSSSGSLNGNYSYIVTYFDSSGNNIQSTAVPISTGGSAGSVDLSNLPTAAPTGCGVRIYQEDLGATTPAYKILQEYPAGSTTFPSTFVDDGSLTPTGAPLVTQSGLTGTYTYYVTYSQSDPPTSGGSETRPIEVGTPLQLNNGQAILKNLPAPKDGTATYSYIQIYRNAPSSGDTTTSYRVGSIDLTKSTSPLSYIDDTPDATVQTHTKLNFDAAAITTATPAVKVFRRDGDQYTPVFQAGTYIFTPNKGSTSLTAKSMTITNATTIGEVMKFMNDAMGILVGQTDKGPASGGTSGYTVVNGAIRFVGNSGTSNALKLDLSQMQLSTGSGSSTVNLPFTTTQSAVGNSAMTDVIVYDSLGNALNVHLTCVLDSTDSTATTYRWYADSPQNTTSTSNAVINVGTGLVKFDGLGNFLSATNTTVNINRVGIAARSPLSFNLDFTQVSGLASATNTLAASRQDGSAPGTLSSYNIGEDGVIMGVFSNGVSRELGQLRLARFANTSGLVQDGQNMYSSGVNSGLPIEGNPGQQGIGSIVAGATELSNTDIGGNLIDLILASTMYQGNSRVITTVQTLFNDLLQIQR